MALPWRQAFKKIISGATSYILNGLARSLRGVMRAVLSTHIGPNELLANGPISATSQLLMTAGPAPLNAVGIHIGRASSNQEVGKVTLQGILLIIPTHLPFLTLMYFAGAIWERLGYAPEITSLIDGYFRPSMYSYMLISLGTISRQLLTGIEHRLRKLEEETGELIPMRPERMAIIANFLGLALMGGLGYLLTFGASPIPALGIAGFPYAALIQSSIHLLLTGAYLAYHRKIMKEIFGFPSVDFRGSLSGLKALWGTAWPMMIQWSGEVIAMMVRTYYAGRLSQAALIAQGINDQVEGLSMSIGFGFSSSVGMATSFAFRQKAFGDFRRLKWSAILLSAGIFASFIVFCTVPVLQNGLASIFFSTTDLHNADALIIFRQSLRWTAIGFLPDYIRGVATRTLNSMGENKIPTLLNLGSIGLGLAAAYCLGFLTDYGLPAISAAGAGALAVAAASTLIYASSREQYHEKQAALPTSSHPAPTSNGYAKLLQKFSGLFSRTNREENQPLLLESSSPKPDINLP